MTQISLSVFTAAQSIPVFASSKSVSPALKTTDNAEMQKASRLALDKLAYVVREKSKKRRFYAVPGNWRLPQSVS